VDGVLLLGRLALAAVFVVAAVGKLADRQTSRQALVDFGVRSALAGPAAIGLSVLELAIACGLIGVASAKWAAVGAAALLTVFCVAIARLMARGEAPDCHCFGKVGAAPVGRGTLMRNLALTGVAAFVAIGGWNHAAESVSTGAADLGALALVLGTTIVLHGVFSWQLFKQNGRLLARLTDLEVAVGTDSVQHSVRHPAIGDRAPGFALPDLAGEVVSLEQLLRPGRGLTVVFTDPKCGPCGSLLPLLGRVRGGQEPVLAVISRGSHAENQANAREHGIALLLLQQNFEVAEAYRAFGVPSAVAIDAAGRIAAARAEGSEAVAELLQAPAVPRLPLNQVASQHALSHVAGAET
jgi:peroxiredoxin